MTTVQAQWCTFFFILAMSLIVVGYDLLAIRAWGFDASISRTLRRGFSYSPTLFAATVFWVGILVGHIFLSTE